MVNFNKNKKGVELALNTIVISILIIIVLLVIILIFTSKMGSTSDALNENSATACNLNNPAIKALGYTKVEPVTYDAASSTEGCNPNYKRISVIPVSSDSKICCGIPK